MATAPHPPRARRRAAALGGLALAAAGLAAWLLAGRTGPPAPSMADIQRASDQRRWPEVERGLIRWLADHPDDAEARLMLGMAQTVQARHDAARATLEAVPPTSPAYGRARNLLGDLAVKEHRAADAERHFRAAADAEPSNLHARQRLIYLLSLQQRPAEARDRLWEIYGLMRDPRVLVDLVLELYAAEDDVRGVPPELDEFLARTPNDPFLRRARGISWLKAGRPAEALPHLEAAAAALSDDPAGRSALAECRLLLGRSAGDLAILGPTPTDPIDAARWWLVRGRLEEALGRDDDAIASLRHAAEAAPNDREPHYRLAQLLDRHGDESRAREHRDRAEDIRARHAAVRREHDHLRRAGIVPSADLYAQLAELCRAAGLIAEARAWLDAAVRLDPLNRPAQQALAQLPRVPPGPPLFLAHPRRVTPGTASQPPSLAAGPLPPGGEGLGRGGRGQPAAEAQAPGLPPTAPRFVDIAQQSGLAFHYDPGAGETLYLADTMGGGVGLIDYDGDGRLDVYFVNGCKLPFDRADPPTPNRLFRNQPDGTFKDVTAQAGVAGLGYGMGCAVGDYDNDGHPDLFLTGLGRTLLYRNRGDGTFEDATAQARVQSDRWTTAAGFADLDADGDLDLVVVTYVDDDLTHPRPCRDHANHPIHCSPKVYPAQPDHLLRNNGDGTFTDVAPDAGFDGPDGRGLGLAIADFDDDGRLDIYVANDASADFLFRNSGGLSFQETGLSAGVAYDGQGRATASMGVVADDLDGDGHIDLFHTNFLNEPNTLHRNLGDGQFVDATLAAGLDAPSQARTGFGAAALDADNDGWLDLFVANGHVDDQPWVQSPMAQRPQLFVNRGGGRFAVAGPAASPYLDRPVVGRGLAAGDLDNDGRVDLVVVHRDAPAALLRNVTPRPGRRLGLRLRGATDPPVGATVRVSAGGREQVHRVTSGTSYLSSNDPRLWIGLGPAERVDRLEIRWPSGHAEVRTDLPIDQVLELRETPSP